jgi:hypothetical protein
MELGTFVDRLHSALAVTAASGTDETQAVAERLAAGLDSATRLVLLEALTEAADTITRDLAPGSVHVRLRGREADFVVTPPPAPQAPTAADHIPSSAEPEPARIAQGPHRGGGGAGRCLGQRMARPHHDRRAGAARWGTAGGLVPQQGRRLGRLTSAHPPINRQRSHPAPRR